MLVRWWPAECNAIYLLCILRAGDIWSLLLQGLTCHSNGLLLVTEKVFSNLI